MFDSSVCWPRTHRIGLTIDALRPASRRAGNRYRSAAVIGQVPEDHFFNSVSHVRDGLVFPDTAAPQGGLTSQEVAYNDRQF